MQHFQKVALFPPDHVWKVRYIPPKLRIVKYCRCTKSCTSWGWHFIPILYRVLYIPKSVHPKSKTFRLLIIFPEKRLMIRAWLSHRFPLFLGRLTSHDRRVDFQLTPARFVTPRISGEAARIFTTHGIARLLGGRQRCGRNLWIQYSLVRFAATWCGMASKFETTYS